MGRPREHDERTAAALLEAAEALLAEGGPDAVSVRGVAEAVGTSTRAVYSVFGSKTGLLRALAVHGYRFLADNVSAVPPTDDPAADLVTVGIRGFRRFAIERPHLFRLTFEQIPPDVRPELSVETKALVAYDALAAWIERAQAAGVVEQRPVPEIAFAFHAACHGLASNELLREPPPVGVSFWHAVRGVDAEYLWRLTLGALVAGLRPESRAGAAAPLGG